MAGKVPDGLKLVQPYIIISKQFEKKDAVIAYYAKLYALQEGMSMAKGNATCKAYLLDVMGQVEQMKKELSHVDGIKNDLIGHSQVESTALKLFKFADERDRSGDFNKAVIKSYFTASHLICLLKQFGDLDEELEEKMRYAKWKAVEIDRCLKAGVLPTPGPPNAHLEPDLDPTSSVMPQPYTDTGGPSSSNDIYPPFESRPVPKPRHNLARDMPPGPSDYTDPTSGPSLPNPPLYPPYSAYPNISAEGGGGGYPNMSQGGGPGVGGGGYPDINTGGGSSVTVGGSSGGGVTLGPEEIAKAQKHCKYATSSLDYDDTAGAIDFLEKALHILKTGKKM